jgi:hypothetical protein
MMIFPKGTSGLESLEGHRKSYEDQKEKEEIIHGGIDKILREINKCKADCHFG